MYRQGAVGINVLPYRLPRRSRIPALAKKIMGVVFETIIITLPL